MLVCLNSACIGFIMPRSKFNSLKYAKEKSRIVNLHHPGLIAYL